MIQKKNGKSVEDSIRFYSQFKCVKRIHIVDLIGAKAKEVKFDYIRSLRKLTTKPRSGWRHSFKTNN